MTDRWSTWRDETLARREAARLTRHTRALAPEGAVHVRLEGRPIVLFSANDYLGLSGHPEVRDAVARAVKRFGMGPRGAALVCGYTTEHAALERDLASLKGQERALLFPTGYAANMATISALGEPGVAIFSDELNHASIIDGIRLARRQGATVHIYRHGDTGHLGELMAASDAPRKLIVTDSVFSMDGDLAPLRELAALRAMHGALLLVDEAHGTLVFGPRGAGVAHMMGVEDAVDIHLGTLSKAAGGQGGFIACAEPWRALVLNRGRAFIYSTALPLATVAGLRAAIRVGARDEELRRRLHIHMRTLSSALGQPVDSPILPIILGDEDRALRASSSLLAAGLHVTAIRPPTVPPGTARLRITLSAAHTTRDIDRLLRALEPLL